MASNTANKIGRIIPLAKINARLKMVREIRTKLSF
jgi:hypothetical protein